ncbi:hypothetical protein, unlikely [Trypanosoma brucei gambiense DAL972]|uniref:T. brucei spp.-specific protein n=1 Tax=Trypanosoma brucei gambiense (strain MHOM/CI/86/DAL972) TaxID=679716 RepID=D0A2F2_TRYB9|nr:hypothetical protein, unlikely [Trypanosoma brucei gambiense DAL972]CBH15446.1 hypothetical protein, unlikely [Trypanosoma brucei gambiense DAL972]|eukprot:XP_011777710.1 hypothetical protein, unlikely [Trypanosoma brucei gambiense DAL972]
MVCYVIFFVTYSHVTIAIDINTHAYYFFCYIEWSWEFGWVNNICQSCVGSLDGCLHAVGASRDRTDLPLPLFLYSFLSPPYSFCHFPHLKPHSPVIAYSVVSRFPHSRCGQS